MTTTGEIPSSTSVLQHHKKYHQQCISTLCAGLKKRSVVLYMSILSIVTPIGVLIGIIVTVHMEQVGWSFTIQQTTIRFYQDRAMHWNCFLFLFLYFHLIEMLPRLVELTCWRLGFSKGWQQEHFFTSPSMRSRCNIYLDQYALLLSVRSL